MGPVETVKGLFSVSISLNSHHLDLLAFRCGPYALNEPLFAFIIDKVFF